MNNYGELRSLLHRAEATSWVAIRSELERMTEAEVLVEVVIPYCRRLMTRWPDDVARNPMPHWCWGWQLASIEAPARLMAMAKLSLCNGAIELRGLPGCAQDWSHHRLVWQARALTIKGHLNAASLSWLSLHTFPRLRRLILDDLEINPGTLGALRRMPWWHTIESLHLGHAEAVDALRGVAMPALSELRLVRCRPASEALVAWFTDLDRAGGSALEIAIHGASYGPGDRMKLVLLEYLPRLNTIRLIDDPFETGGLDLLQDALADLHVFSGDD